MQICKYLVVNPRDVQWGLTVSTVGYEEIGVADTYPTRGHADGYYFDIDKGPKVRIKDINFIGNEHVSDYTLAKSMKKTKSNKFYNFFKNSIICLIVSHNLS